VLSGHVATVAGASFSRDGRWIVTAGPGAGGLWQAENGARIVFLRGHDGALRAATFSPDGAWVATGGVDGTVRTYRCELCGELPDLTALARRRLAALERASAASRRLSGR
jgi:WD40 repeat protein